MSQGYEKPETSADERRADDENDIDFGREERAQNSGESLRKVDGRTDYDRATRMGKMHSSKHSHSVEVFDTPHILSPTVGQNSLRMMRISAYDIDTPSISRQIGGELVDHHRGGVDFRRKDLGRDEDTGQVTPSLSEAGPRSPLSWNISSKPFD